MMIPLFELVVKKTVLSLVVKLCEKKQKVTLNTFVSILFFCAQFQSFYHVSIHAFTSTKTDKNRFLPLKCNVPSPIFFKHPQFHLFYKKKNTHLGHVPCTTFSVSRGIFLVSLSIMCWGTILFIDAPLYLCGGASPGRRHQID